MKDKEDLKKYKYFQCPIDSNNISEVVDIAYKYTAEKDKFYAAWKIMCPNDDNFPFSDIINPTLWTNEQAQFILIPVVPRDGDESLKELHRCRDTYRKVLEMYWDIMKDCIEELARFYSDHDDVILIDREEFNQYFPKGVTDAILHHLDCCGIDLGE